MSRKSKWKVDSVIGNNCRKCGNIITNETKCGHYQGNICRPCSNLISKNIRADYDISQCKVCGVIITHENARKRQKYTCRSCHNKTVSDRRKRNKYKIMKEMGGECSKCGYNKCLAALDFHHVEPHTKELDMAKTVLSLKNLREEAKKCILLCSNCHRELHYG